MKEIQAIAEQLYALELLEYHNKNFLAEDNCRRSEYRLCLLSDLIKIATANGGCEGRATV